MGYSLLNKAIIPTTKGTASPLNSLLNAGILEPYETIFSFFIKQRARMDKRRILTQTKDSVMITIVEYKENGDQQDESPRRRLSMVWHA